MTHGGCRVFEEVAGELAKSVIVDRFHAGVCAGSAARVWARWRRPTHAELVRTWPARTPPSPAELTRGW
jgi:hypothetical protein